MFPNHTTQSLKALKRLRFLPVVALAMVLALSAMFTFSSASAVTPSGDFCIEGLVIDWEEEPLAGWEVIISGTNTAYNQAFTSASEPDDDDDLEEGEFETGDIPPDNYLAELILQDGWEGVTDTVIEIPLTKAGRDDCVRIRFKVRQIVQVVVLKIDHEHNPLSDWEIEAVPGPGNFFAEVEDETTNISGTAVFTLTPGNWIFKEMQPDKDDYEEAYDETLGKYVPVVPPHGVQTLDVKASDGPYTITFKNKIMKGCIRVQKYAVPVVNSAPADALMQPVGPFVGQYGVAGWAFKLLLADGTVYRKGITDARGIIDFEHLPFGPYTIVEEDRPGWSETSIPSSFTKYDHTLVSAFPGCDENEVSFYNEQDDSAFCVEGRKIDVNGGYGIPGWEIKVKPLDEGGFDPGNVFTDGLGEFRIEFPTDDYRIPGAEYEICEDEEDGWLQASPSCQKVRLPEWPMGYCIQLEDFVNQQVGHKEKVKQEHKEEMHEEYAEKAYANDRNDNGMSGDKYGKPSDNYGKPGDDYGKPGDKYGKPGDNYGKPGMENGKMDMCYKFHVVGKGEGLFDIGAKYKVTPQDMLDANPDVRKNDHLWLYEGQEVCVP